MSNRCSEHSQWKKGVHRKVKPLLEPKEPTIMEIQKESQKSPDVFCPRCKSPMVKRINKKTNRPFYGCVMYPKCNGTKNQRIVIKKSDKDLQVWRRLNKLERDMNDPLLDIGL